MTKQPDEEVLSPERLEEEAFQDLTSRQAKYVREWVKGSTSRVDAYRKAFDKTGPTTTGNRTCAASLHNKPKIQKAIRILTARENSKSLLTRHEKRLFLAQVVRAHLPGQRELDPQSPFLKMDPLMAVKIDNEMSGDNAPRELTGEITLGAILTDLRGGRLIDGTKSVEPLPIPAAGGGFGELPGRGENGHSNGNGNGNGHKPALESFDISPDALARFRTPLDSGEQ